MRARRQPTAGRDGGAGRNAGPTAMTLGTGPAAKPVTGPAVPAQSSPCGPQSDGELTAVHRHALLRIVTDTDVRLWRRVHMDLVRYAGCVCRPSC
ncbi:putative leader peptide [Streptomyces sp. B21-105]|uniref:putative leader peptide n=1 Tax=Streptomyces sp. B21-105 TaxID=3039417 RepID=UPI003FA7BDF7